MPRLTTIELTDDQGEHADAHQVDGTLVIRHGDPETPHELRLGGVTNLVELAVAVADALALQAARDEQSARLDQPHREVTVATDERLRHAIGVLHGASYRLLGIRVLDDARQQALAQ